MIADLDPSIARAVRETWPKAILYHSRHHLEELMRKRAIADGVPERHKLEQPTNLARPLPWTGSSVKRWGDHPLHGNKVHPSESFAAYFPWLVKEWHPTKNDLRPDQVTRASGREIHWICEFGHEWPAPVYSRTLSETGCPECFRLGHVAKAKAGYKRRRKATDDRVQAQVALLAPTPDTA